MNNDSKRFWAWPDELAQSGVLGINRRNVGVIFENNPRHLYPSVDNKLKTKKICESRGIMVPETYGVLYEHSDCRRFLQMIGDRTEFVVKPASGAAGRGIVVVARRAGNVFYTSSDREIPWSELRYHLSTVLSGLYSLGGQLDQVIVERRIVSHPLLMNIAVEGTPDIRVIVYRGVPVMAMIRLSTIRSGGRANLHQGAAAAAVDLETGVTYGGVCEDRAITHHPDTKQPLTGIEIPSWSELLDAAMHTSEALKMGYVGVDFVIDINMGPVVLEANARPGLAIQLAHGRGILPRLDFVDSLPKEMRIGQRRWELIPRVAKLSAPPSLDVLSD